MRIPLKRTPSITNRRMGTHRLSEVAKRAPAAAKAEEIRRGPTASINVYDVEHPTCNVWLPPGVLVIETRTLYPGARTCGGVHPRRVALPQASCTIYGTCLSSHASPKHVMTRPCPETSLPFTCLLTPRILHFGSLPSSAPGELERRRAQTLRKMGPPARRMGCGHRLG